MTVRRFATPLAYSLVGVLALAGSWSGSQAQDHQDHQSHLKKPQTPEQQKKAGAFVQLVRATSQRFADVAVAEAEGYAPQFGCVSGSDAGAMGVHYVNGALVQDGVLDATRPELLVYEPQRNGRLKLIGVDYLVFKETWHANNAGTPELMGQLFHLFESPNRYGLPSFYTLHVWAWKENPNGSFVNWHPDVTCEHYVPQVLEPGA